MSIRNGLLVSCLGLVLLAACEKKEPTVEEGVAQLTEAAGELSSAIFNFSQEKIEDLAKVAVQLEKAPEEGLKMLEKHGWSRDEFDKMIEQVQGNESAKKIFDAAKKAATGH